MLTSQDVSELVRKELARIDDITLLTRMRPLLVTPYSVERDWHYGLPGEHFTCWAVLEHSPSNTGIAYCPFGFGFSDPWGLVFLAGDDMSIGIDGEWFPTLEQAMRTGMNVG